MQYQSRYMRTGHSLAAKRTFAIVVALVGATCIVLITSGPGGPSIGLPASTSTELPALDYPVSADPPSGNGDGNRVAAPDSSPILAASVTGRVLAADGHPFPNAVVSLLRLDGANAAEARISDPEGAFAWHELSPRPYRIRAEAAGVLEELTIVAPAEELVLRLPATPARPGIAVIVDAFDTHGRLVADAEVGVFPHSNQIGPPVLRGRTDREGRCVFAGTPLARAMIVVRTADGRAGVDHQYPGRPCRDPTVVQVIVQHGGALLGSVRVVGSEARLAGSATVVAHLGSYRRPFERQHSPTFETPIEGDRYRFVGLPAAAYCLYVRGAAESGLQPCGIDSSGTTVIAPTEGWIAPTTASVRMNESTSCDLQLAPGASISGVVTAVEGQPLAAASVRCVRLLDRARSLDGSQLLGAPVEPRTESSGEPHPNYERMVPTSSDGFYRLDGLMPGPYRLEVSARGRGLVRDSTLLLAGGERVRRDLALPCAGALEGVVGHASVLVAWSEAGATARAQATDAGGTFHLRGIAAGRYHIGVVENTEFAGQRLTISSAPESLATVDVEPDRTSFVDLRELLPVRIAGVLFGNGRLLSHVRLSLCGRNTTTDSDGRFTFRFADLIHGSEQVGVHLGGLTLGLRLPESVIGAPDWFGRLELNTVETTLTARTASGLPTSATVHVTDSSGGQLGRLAIAQREASITVPLPAGTFYAHVEFANGARVTRGFSAGTNVEFVGRECGEIRVLVTDMSNRPRALTGVHVSTWIGATPPPEYWSPHSGETCVTMSESSTDATGCVVFAGVTSGQVLIQVAASLGHAGPPLAHRVTLGTGQVVNVHLRQE